MIFLIKLGKKKNIAKVMIMHLFLVIHYAILNVEGGQVCPHDTCSKWRGGAPCFTPCSLYVEIQTLKVNICVADWLE